ncbi:MAG: hypothetical protein Ta2D_06260 [Rickettsiales bacterium]|nr:MAG: hypothetical protein Ta2D_06260 [Rickettsiales bacterium]
MFKLLSFISIYILSIINFAILLLPLIVVFMPIAFTGIPLATNSIISIVLLIFLFINVIVLLALIADLLFGFTTQSYIKSTTPYLKIKNYDLLTKGFEDLKLQFKTPNVELRVSNEDQINAFAVGCMQKKCIVITKGLVSAYLMNCKGNIGQFTNNMNCIIGHEMSHLINKDYLPGLLLHLNEMATNFISKIIVSILKMFFCLFFYIPFIGSYLGKLLIYIYKTINFIIKFFHNYIVINFYKFLQLKISRTYEYRCDMQSAIANGGKEMASTLSFLGGEGYTSIFSTHPSTKSRMQKVINIEKQGTLISPAGHNFIINTFALLFAFSLPYILLKFIDIKGLQNNWGAIVFNVISRYNIYRDSFKNWFNRMITR